jgi:hypothetical protein
MTSNTKVIPLHPYNTIEIDDTRLQAMWRSHDRRQGMLFGVLGLAGVAATMLGVAAIVWAAMSAQPAPQIKVDVHMPKQEPPVINIAPPAAQPGLPQAPMPPSASNEGQPVTEYVIFHVVNVVGHTVHTGWKYGRSTDSAPYKQWCYVNIDTTMRLDLGFDGALSSRLEEDVRKIGMSEQEARELAQSCKWHPKPLKSPDEQPAVKPGALKF